MKKLLFLLSLSLLMIPAFAQNEDGKLSQSKDTVIEVEPNGEITTTYPIKDVANEVLKVITNDPNVQITTPDKIDVNNPASIQTWYGFIVALIAPFLTWILSLFWPSGTKNELIIKSSGVVIVLVIAIVAMKGEFNVGALIQLFIGLIGNAFSYDKIYKPIGMTSKVKYDRK